MAAEAGFDVRLKVMEFAARSTRTSPATSRRAMWAGPAGPTPTAHPQFVTCKGNLNDGRYCNPKVDELLNQARRVSDQAKRKALYDQAMAILADELPTSTVYFEPRIFALSKKVQGFKAHPDGMIRLAGVRLAG